MLIMVIRRWFTLQCLASMLRFMKFRISKSLLYRICNFSRYTLTIFVKTRGISLLISLPYKHENYLRPNLVSSPKLQQTLNIYIFCGLAQQKQNTLHN